MEIYVVKSGDTYDSIANEYHVDVETMLRNNGLHRGLSLVVGQTIVILYPNQTYMVESGDTLQGIAIKLGITQNELLRNNTWLTYPYILYEGEELVLSYETTKSGPTTISGYVYPFVDERFLFKSLPFLTNLMIFSYHFDENGNLILIKDTPSLQLAHGFYTNPILTLTAMGPDGNFNSEMAHELLNNPQMQVTLIQDLIQILERKGYRGVDVDFEYLYPEDRDNYTQFLRILTDQLRPYGYTIGVALAPKTSDEQQGILYEAHDYQEIGRIVDYVFLMTYEWGYGGGPAMAVAPIDKVKEVLDYAVTKIPRDKITFGIPNYGYDWSLPFVEGEQARVISNTEAVRIAAQYRAEIQFDEIAKSPYFVYTDEQGTKHEVWFEDARSIEAKLKLIEEDDLKGAGYWNLMKDFPQNWLVLNSMYDIIKDNG